jgi:hypothetical protein
MIIRHIRVMTKPGLQAGTHHPRFLLRLFLSRSAPLRVPVGGDTTRGVLVALLAMSAAVSLQAQSGSATRYRVSSTAVIALDRAAQTPLVDTVTTTSLVTIELSSGVDTVATLSIDSLQLTSTGMVRRTADAFSRGISVSALLANGRPLITGDSASACTVERPLAALLPELLPLMPTPLRAEQQWSDTLIVTTCRAGLPVTTTTIAAYRTLTGLDTATVLLERRAVMRAMGQAQLRQQTVTLDGTGTSESLAVVLVATRRIQSWRSTQSLDVQLTNGQQTRRVVQQLTDTASLIP